MEKVSQETVKKSWKLPNLAQDHLAMAAGKGVWFVIGAIVKVPVQGVQGLIQGFKQSFK